MKVSIILAHPNPESLNHAIAKSAEAELHRLGHNVRLHDLCQEQFNPLLPVEELGRDPQLGSVLRQHCHEIVEADGIVIVHPNWWGMPPAILKGWIDRVLRMGVAYRFTANDKGEGVPQGLLKAKSAIVFNTANTPEDREREWFGDPLELLWKKCVFGLCGVRKVERRTFSVVITSTAEQRMKWLSEVRQMVAAHYPAEKRASAPGACRQSRLPAGR